MRAAAGVIFAVAVALYAAAWWVTWFECDDAYIAFRYVANAMLDRGYTWNPPPFRPVEGYSSFAWLVVLEGVWRGFGIEPPDSATWISFGCGVLTLGLLGAAAWALPLGDRFARYRLAVLALVLVGTATNRTFVIWTSSGLETALMTLLLVAWVLVAVLQRPFAPFGARGAAWTGILAILGALLSLTRPEGVLYAIATLGFVVARLRRGSRPADLLAAAPLVAPLVHFAWRKQEYGYWLPNTFHAKHIGAWPGAGANYLLAFVTEYFLWPWIAVAIVAGFRWLRAGPRLDAPGLVAAAAIGVFAFQHAYYTFVVGGDHFEYRVYHAAVPMLLLAFPWLAERAGLSAPAALLTGALTVGLGSVLPWVDFAVTRDQTTFTEPPPRLAPLAPWPVSAYVDLHDDNVRWLFRRMIAVRLPTHRALVAYQRDAFPPRETGLKMPEYAYPTRPEGAAGVAGWRLPHVGILDIFGLNDLVIARNPDLRFEIRHMAHDRQPPAGYIECFSPNVEVGRHPDGSPRLIVTTRSEPLTSAKIVECEATWLARVEAQ